MFTVQVDERHVLRELITRAENGSHFRRDQLILDETHVLRELITRAENG